MLMSSNKKDQIGFESSLNKPIFLYTDKNLYTV